MENLGLRALHVIKFSRLLSSFAKGITGFPFLNNLEKPFFCKPLQEAGVLVALSRTEERSAVLCAQVFLPKIKIKKGGSKLWVQRSHIHWKLNKRCALFDL